MLSLPTSRNSPQIVRFNRLMSIVNQFEIHKDILFIPISVLLVCTDKSQKTL